MQERTQLILHLCFMFTIYSLWKEHNEASYQFYKLKAEGRFLLRYIKYTNYTAVLRVTVMGNLFRFSI